MTEPKNQNQNEHSGSPDELLGDLESIKRVLEEGRAPDVSTPPAEAGERDTTVPLLEDMVDDAIQLREARLEDPTSPSLQPHGRRRRDRLSSQLFDSLLRHQSKSSEWKPSESKPSASEILSDARDAIESNREFWTPEDTAELNNALRIRIDTTLSEWLHDTLNERVDELRRELLQAAEAVISEKISSLTERAHLSSTSEDDR